MLTITTLNLLEELGVTNRRLLKKSPALTLFSDPTGEDHHDGTMMIWSSWAWAKQELTPPKHYNPRSRYERWLRARVVGDLKQVQKIKYKEDIDPAQCGRVDMTTYAASVQFFKAAPRSAPVYFEVDPLWLAVPEVREFLNTYTPFGIRNDFNPTLNWALRRRGRISLFGDADVRLKDTTQVLSKYGAITWKHDDGTAVVNVFGTRFQRPSENVIDSPVHSS